MIKRIISCIIILSLIITCSSGSIINAASTDAVNLEPYAKLFGNDLSSLNLNDKENLLSTLAFSSRTKWPTSDKMPESFDPQKILEYGKDPGLGIKRLHELGYTGKGVSIAYIDQPLLTNHIEYKDTNVSYYKIRPDTSGMKTSMHGPAVLSLLAG